LPAVGLRRARRTDNFTDQGLKNIKDTVKRAEAVKKAGAAMGATIKEIA